MISNHIYKTVIICTYLCISTTSLVYICIAHIKVNLLSVNHYIEIYNALLYINI